MTQLHMRIQIFTIALKLVVYNTMSDLTSECALFEVTKSLTTSGDTFVLNTCIFIM